MPSARQPLSAGRPPRLHLLAMCAALVTAAAPTSWAGAEEIHSPLPTRAPAAPSQLAADAKVTAAGLTPAARAVGTALACACFENAELRIDASLSLADARCDCAYADRVRADLAEIVGLASPEELSNKAAMALRVESELLPRSPDYERLLRFDAAAYRYFLENVRCICEGCKATVYFSNCQLTCAPAIVYKRRARVFLASGIPVDGLIDFYLAEHNATHPPREQVTREFLLPRKQKQRGWGVPAALIGGAILGLGLLLGRVARRRQRADRAEAASAAGVAETAAGLGDASGPPAALAMTAAERAALEEALDGLDATEGEDLDELDDLIGLDGGVNAKDAADVARHSAPSSGASGQDTPPEPR